MTASGSYVHWKKGQLQGVKRPKTSPDSGRASFRLEKAMKAIVQDKYGSPDYLELREVAKPAIGDDEVLVRVRAASLHPDVWHVVSGWPWVIRLMGAGFSKPKNPIPGTDMAGIVESVGVNVTQFRQGDEVFGEPSTPIYGSTAVPLPNTCPFDQSGWR